MNYKQLTDEYLQCTNKAYWVKQTAKKYGVAGSDIICELMKSGYKYKELARVSESQYNSAVNKYHKWQEEGCPATELIPVEQEEQPEEKKKETKVEIKPETEGETVQKVMEAPELTAEEKHEAASLESYEKTIALLNAEIVRLQEEKESLKGVIEIKDKSIQELLTENANLKNSLHNREDDIFEFKGKLESAMDLVKTREEKIEELEKKIKHLKTSDFNSTIDGMVSESKLSTANERIKELEKELSFYEDEKDGDGVVIEQLKATNEILKSKLSKCEQYILDLMVYTEV